MGGLPLPGRLAAGNSAGTKGGDDLVGRIPRRIQRGVSHHSGQGKRWCKARLARGDKGSLLTGGGVLEVRGEGGKDEERRGGVGRKEVRHSIKFDNENE